MAENTQQPESAVDVGSTRLVGQFGEFTGGDGTVYECRIDDASDDATLRVKYWRASWVRMGWIVRHEFRPNDKVSSGAKDQ